MSSRMSDRTTLFHFLSWGACAVCLIGVSLWLILARRTPRGDRPTSSTEDVLFIPPERLSFGETWEEGRFRWTLPIENRSDQDIEIASFATSCNCTQVEPPSLIVPARQLCEVSLTLDLTPKHGERSDASGSDFAVAITPRLAAAGKTRAGREWMVCGRVKAAILLEQEAVDFGRRSERTQPIPPNKLRVASGVPIETLLVAGATPDFAARAHRASEDPSRFEIEITPRAGLPVGAHRATLSLTPQLADGRRLPAKELVVRALLVPDIQASPPEVLFGAVMVGESVEATVTLDSLSGRQFTVKGWDCSGTQVRVDSEAASPSDSPSYRIKLKATAPENQMVEVVFQVKTDEGEGATVVIPVRFLGVETSSK